MATLLEAYDPNTIAAPALRHHCGSVVIQFNHPADGLHPILLPELRRFLRVLAQRWGPHSAPFFCEMQSPFLLMYFTAQLDHLWVGDYLTKKDFLVRHRPDELESLRQTANAGLQQFGRRAGLTASEIRRRQLRIARLFATVFIYPLHS
jgi:hypothetical protein